MQNDPQYPPQPQPQPQPQYPQYQQYPPQGPYYGVPGVPQQPMMTTYTRGTSFTNKAVIAFLLYFVGYIPGLIFNVMYLNEANNVKKEIGRTPEGMGCLWATLAGSLLPLLAFCALCAMLGALGHGGGSTVTP